MGSAGAGDERKNRRRTLSGTNRNARPFAVGCCFIECVSERSPIRVGHRGTIQPVDATQRRADRGQGPLAFGRIGDGDTRDLAARIVSGKDPIARTIPAIVALIVGRWNASADGRPPLRQRRIDLDRLELNETTGGTFALRGHAKANGRLSVDLRQYKAPLVEPETRQHCRRSPFIGPDVDLGAKDRIALCLVGPPTRRLDFAPGAAAEEIGNAHRFARAKVEHASARRMPRRPVRQVDLDVVLVREVWTKDAEYVDLSSGRGGRIVVAFIVWSERSLVGMRTGIRASNARDCCVLEDDGAVARHEIAAIETLADEQGILI
jgi:hypothetical protein